MVVKISSGHADDRQPAEKRWRQIREEPPKGRQEPPKIRRREKVPLEGAATEDLCSDTISQLTAGRNLIQMTALIKAKNKNYIEKEKADQSDNEIIPRLCRFPPTLGKWRKIYILQRLFLLHSFLSGEANLSRQNCWLSRTTTASLRTTMSTTKMKMTTRKTTNRQMIAAMVPLRRSEGSQSYMGPSLSTRARWENRLWKFFRGKIMFLQHFTPHTLICETGADPRYDQACWVPWQAGRPRGFCPGVAHKRLLRENWISGKFSPHCGSAVTWTFGSNLSSQ